MILMILHGRCKAWLLLARDVVLPCAIVRDRLLNQLAIGAEQEALVVRPIRVFCCHRISTI